MIARSRSSADRKYIAFFSQKTFLGKKTTFEEDDVVTFHTAEDDAEELQHFPGMNKVSH